MPDADDVWPAGTSVCGVESGRGGKTTRIVCHCGLTLTAGPVTKEGQIGHGAEKCSGSRAERFEM